ncbi:MAG TPA: biotin--[acetyl-CoA-carboxylase] ligase, partial [Candidatus Ozemobacteraceae bacterium]|nr:biotin--[acetyl-CoA-carboxylase] ligase [Candidatus Ozemobacteraceae bacterium]
MTDPETVRLPPHWDELAEFMKTLPAWKNHRLEWVARTGSTSDDLKSDWKGTPGAARLRVAGYQSAGRGQRGRHWITAPGDGLLFSFSWDWPHPDSAWEIPFRAGLAVRDALVPFVDDGLSLWLKWPNDLCAGAGKLAGILVESTWVDGALKIIAGIGI